MNFSYLDFFVKKWHTFLIFLLHTRFFCKIFDENCYIPAFFPENNAHFCYIPAFTFLYSAFLVHTVGIHIPAFSMKCLSTYIHHLCKKNFFGKMSLTRFFHKTAEYVSGNLPCQPICIFHDIHQISTSQKSCETKYQ